MDVILPAFVLACFKENDNVALKQLLIDHLDSYR